MTAFALQCQIRPEFAMATEMRDESITKEGIKVEVGQVWQDLDKRMHNRKCRVVDVTQGKATMQSIYSDAVPATKMAVRRMHKGSTGWSLVREG